jgi:transcriptional regulator with XRE-family HTH domain
MGGHGLCFVTAWMVMDGEDIKQWRSLNRIKQEALAAMLGVSHVAVSKWENGHSRPSRIMALRLQDVMSGLHQGRLAAEIAFTAPQMQMKVLTRGRHMQLVGISSGFLSAYPEFDGFRGLEMRPFMMNEAEHYCERSDLLKEACRGDILMLSGISNRVVRVGSDVPAHFRLRWHTIVRHIDGEVIHEVIFEPCAADMATGFENVLRRGEIEKFQG